jgi:release factor glutamine methyltransferase
MTSKPPSSTEPAPPEAFSSGEQLSLGAWLRSIRCSLPAPTESDAPTRQELYLSAQVLLASVIAKPRAWLLAHPEAILDAEQHAHLDTLFEQLCLGMPLPYLTGKQDFFGLEFVVTPDVLIPRPETELLVERGIQWLGRHPNCRLAADVGTGSGCIAISLAAHSPTLHWLAVDQSWRALQVARRNALHHQVADRVHLLNGDLLSACTGPFDLVCANLPYIPHAILRFLPLLKYEPVTALDGGTDGLDPIRELLISAPRWLALNGLILLEMQFDQGEKIAHLAKTCLPAAQVSIHNDLAGKPRVVEIHNRKGDLDR